MLVGASWPWLSVTSSERGTGTVVTRRWAIHGRGGPCRPGRVKTLSRVAAAVVSVKWRHSNSFKRTGATAARRFSRTGYTSHDNCVTFYVLKYISCLIRHSSRVRSPPVQCIDTVDVRPCYYRKEQPKLGHRHRRVPSPKTQSREGRRATLPQTNPWTPIVGPPKQYWGCPFPARRKPSQARQAIAPNGSRMIGFPRPKLQTLSLTHTPRDDGGGERPGRVGPTRARLCGRRQGSPAA